jgi:hypothetical protein
MKTIALLLCVFQGTCLASNDMDEVKYFLQMQMEEANEEMVKNDNIWDYPYWVGRYCAFKETIEFIQRSTD